MGRFGGSCQGGDGRVSLTCEEMRVNEFYDVGWLYGMVQSAE